MRRSLKWTAALAITVPALVISGFLAGSKAPDDAARVFDEVLRRVANDAVDSIPAAELYEKAARGLVDKLEDPYADLYSPEQLSSFSRNQLGNRYGGLGMQIEQQQGTIVITGVFPNTPAERGGVQNGDRIVAVDSASAAGWTIDQTSGHLTGAPGTSVNVTFARAGVTQPIRIDFTRAVIHVPVVPYAVMLDDRIGYIPVQRFNDESHDEVARSLKQLAGQGARAFILDLRGNPGGSLDESIAMSNLFLKPGQSIVDVRYRNQPNAEYHAKEAPVAGDAPVIVLVDGYTASASEIVAGSLQDHDRALILGTTSFGKGLVQSLFPLQGGWGLKMTTGKWYTPSGRSIQRPRKKGTLIPDSTMETDSARRARPAFHSDGGRVVYGGGGITPDVVIQPDTATTPEQQLLRALAPKSQQTHATLYSYALELRKSVRPDFKVSDTWRDTLYSRLTSAGVTVDHAKYVAGERVIDRMLEERVASLAFGDSAAFRRSIPEDPQLVKAIALLHGRRSQAEVLAAAGH
ncbi:MAG: S41 family peptidase [Gemmatimonadota bacterium]